MSKPVQIVADIGGTNARFAYVESDSDELLGIEIFPCADFPFFVDAIRAYMERGHVAQVDKICLAVAGPVESDLIDLPNNHWSFSRAELQSSLGVSATIINDFSAQVLCIDALSDSELRWIGSARPAGGQVKAVLGPGTGLGVSAMLQEGDILPSEGGHVAFAPLTDHEADLQKQLRQRYERVSVERVLSGMGLANLYWANGRLDGYDRELPAPEVTAGALAGDLYCLRAVEDFCSILGSVAGDVALMMGAADGVYISGGILPRRFDDKGRFTEICSKIPLAIVLAEHPGLRGCVGALRKGL
ncbi:MAG: glucokinase [Halioglobus sp.]